MTAPTRSAGHAGEPGAERAVPARGPGPGPGGPPRQGPGAWMAGRPTERSLDFRGSGRRLLRTLRPQRAAIVAVVLLGVGNVTLMVLGPWLLGRATDVIFAGVIGRDLPAGVPPADVVARLRAEGQDTRAELVQALGVVPGAGIDTGRVAQVLLAALAVYLVAFVLGVLQGRLTTTLVQTAVRDLRETAQAKLARLPLGYVDRKTHGEVLSRVTNDVDNLQQSLQQTLSQIISSLLTIVGVLVMMLVISPLLALVALVSVPLSVWLAATIGRRAQPQFVQQWSSTGRLNGHVEEMFTGHALVRAFGREREARERFAEHNAALAEAGFRAQFMSGLIQPALMFIGNVNYLLVAVIGAFRVTSGQLTVGEVQAFVQYTRQFGMPLTQVASMANLLQSAVASAERIFALLDAEEESPDPDRPVHPGQVSGRVELRDVSFGYRPDQPLIRNLSLSVEPGSTVAIVGPTGAGKTTLVNLLLRFYDLDGGAILLDGVDVSSMRRSDVRSCFGMVLQDTWLFGGTIRENIAYGAEGATDEDVLAAAQAADVDRVVRTLPQGYDTVIDDEGSGVSAGERQLITIARAFLADPPILVLDEATSSVDTRTEVLIQRAMHSLRAGRTSFVIAHRLSTIRDADTILVMEAGRIVEQGSHEELVAAGGAYARLHAAQFAGPATS